MKRIPIGILRLNIDTLLNHYMYEETDRFHKFLPIYMCGRVRRVDRNLTYHHEPVKMFRYKGLHVPVFSDSAKQRFRNLVLKRNIKLFYAQLIYDAIPFLFLISETGLPLFINFRGGDFASPVVNFFLDKIISRTTVVLTKSNYQKKLLIRKGFPKNKASVSFGGINIGNIPYKSRKINPEKLKILSAGRYIEKKGFNLTIKFFKKLLCSKPNATLTLVSEGLTQKILDQIVGNQSVLKRIILLPYLQHDSFIKILHSNDIFILPSRRTAQNDMEGIPNVLKESLASGMPTISTKHSGIPELIKDNNTGFLVKENDYAGIYKKVKFIIDNPAKTCSICRNARSFIEKNFDINMTTSKLEDLLIQKINP